MSTTTPLSRIPLAFSLVVLLLLSLIPVAAGATPASVGGGDRLPGQILVKFADGAPGAAVAQARRDAAAEELAPIAALGVRVWRVPDHASDRVLGALQRNPHVEYAELDGVVELDAVVPSDPEFSRQWGVVRTRTDHAWAVSRGAGSVIAVLDTGVNPVGDLRGKLLPGRNVMASSSDTTDHNGHGTMSAGVAGAATDNGVGIAGFGWDAKILPVKVMESSGVMSDLARGIVWATDNGADIISMSLSGPSGSSTVLDAVRYARDRDVNLVAAAGNGGSDVERYPAAYGEVIAVAGTTSSDTLYSWSNHGAWVDVAAPGQNWTYNGDGSLFPYAGTSSATPVVAGILSLARSHGADAARARSALEGGSQPLSTVRHGRVDAWSMLELLGTAPAPDGDPEPAPEPEPAPAPAPAPDPDPVISLAVSTTKARGVNTAILRWSGATGTAVAVSIDGASSTVSNTGSFTHQTGARGNPTITYQVCDAAGCSAAVTVSHW